MDGYIRAGYLDCILLYIATGQYMYCSIGQFCKMYCLLNLNDLYFPGGYTIGAKPNWIAWFAPVDLSSVQKPNLITWAAESFFSSAMVNDVI